MILSGTQCTGRFLICGGSSILLSAESMYVSCCIKIRGEIKRSDRSGLQNAQYFQIY